MSHTEGTLSLVGDKGLYLWDKQGKPIARTLAVRTKPAAARENARRLMACWNACAAISTESLETELSTVTAWSRTAKQLIATMTQRDDLLEALKQARLYVAGEAVPTKAHALEIIDAAIAKVQL